MIAESRATCTLVTGATGFLGPVVLAELLRRGHRCVALVRDPRAGAATLHARLAELGGGGEREAEGRVTFARGDLPGVLPAGACARVDRVVHVAACTRFERDASGDPHRTNAQGTESLLRWCDEHRVREFHLVSTAYACGRVRGAIPERVLERPGRFRNDYEHSKWLAERHVHGWGCTGMKSWSILRPSIIVGEYASGRAASTGGLYIALRAFSRAAGRVREAGAGFRLEGSGEGSINLVPVDHVARAIARVVDSPGLHGKVYNLVDPCPPSNGRLLEQVQRVHGLRGCRFVRRGEWDGAAPSAVERAFSISVGTLGPYMDGACDFDRSNTECLERDGLGDWPRWDGASLRRLIVAAGVGGPAGVRVKG